MVVTQQGGGTGANTLTSFSSSSDLLAVLHFSHIDQKARDQGSPQWGTGQDGEWIWRGKWKLHSKYMW